MDSQVIIMIALVLSFVLLGFMMNKSIKKLETKKATEKKKKGRMKYMQEAKRPGK